MESKNMIHTGCCDLCGDQNASVAPLGNDMVCGVCNPDNWARVADEEKSAWLLGQLDDQITL